MYLLDSILAVTVTKEHCHLVVWNLYIQQTNQNFKHNTANRYDVMGCEKLCKMIARMIRKTEEPNSDPHLAYLIYRFTSREVWPATC